MALFDQWPYVNIHDLNTDWLVKTVKAVKDLAEAITEKIDLIDDSVERARDSAANAKTSEDNAKASEDAAKDYYDLTSVLVGKPLSANLLSDMTDTTTIYVYTGNEPDMVPGDWYYYDGDEWVDGGKYGGDGGINTNARNLLNYILERIVYTEPDMNVYIEALYNALVHEDATPITYSITNALINVTNSNNATGCNLGDSYTGTLTPDEGFLMGTVTITMGNVDITSSVYRNGVINIPSVSGDIVITATAEGVKYSYVYTDGDLVKVDGALSWTSERGAYIDYNPGTAKRRGFVVTNGVVPFKEKVNDSTYIDTNYYPIPIPSDATSVSISITPNTQFHGDGFLILSNGAYTRTYDPGWKQGSFTFTFTAGTYEYLTINCKYDRSGTTYPVEPSEMTVTFNV